MKVLCRLFLLLSVFISLKTARAQIDVDSLANDTNHVGGLLFGDDADYDV